jgi:uncharacterized protein (DUF433 family)
MPVISTDDVLGGEPRLEGRRISVLHVAELVVGGHSPAHVADQLDISLAEVHEAMAYYYNHPEEMSELRAAHGELAEELAERSDAPTKPA